MAQVVHKVSPAVMWERIHAAPEEIAAFCRAYHIRWLALFGSVLREDFRPDSDIDVLVEFDPTRRVTFFTLHEIEGELTAMMQGHTANVVTRDSLHRALRARVLALAEVLYAEGSADLSRTHA